MTTILGLNLPEECLHKNLGQLADEELEAFEKFFMAELKNPEPLAPSERSIVKTYLLWKLRAKEKTGD